MNVILDLIYSLTEKGLNREDTILLSRNLTVFGSKTLVNPLLAEIFRNVTPVVC
jgi:hypothetical protein